MGFYKPRNSILNSLYFVLKKENFTDQKTFVDRIKKMEFIIDLETKQI